MITHRRDFIRIATAGAASFLLSPRELSAQTDERAQYSANLINEFVIAGHKDLGRVQEMLAEHPNLLNCTWDWGGGDFEMAIGGAGHVGNREIAEFLIGAGARVNLFVLTMLGRTELVKPVLEAYPDLVFAKGPHGFTMLHHAKQGGDDAAELHEYLLARGLRETKVSL